MSSYRRVVVSSSLVCRGVVVSSSLSCHRHRCVVISSCHRVVASSHRWMQFTGPVVLLLCRHVALLAVVLVKHNWLPPERRYFGSRRVVVSLCRLVVVLSDRSAVVVVVPLTLLL